MTYRDRDPLEVEETVLAQELAALEERARSVKTALDDARTRKRTSRSLPLLSNTAVASPCSARWDDMVGDDHARFCGACQKNVYDLSSMTAAAAEELLASKDGNLCVRFYRRADGTVLTQDCPVGVRKKRVRRVAAAVVFGAGATFVGFGALGATTMGARRVELGDRTISQGPEPELLQGAFVSVDSKNPPPKLTPPITLGSSAPEAPQSKPRR